MNLHQHPFSRITKPETIVEAFTAWSALMTFGNVAEGGVTPGCAIATLISKPIDYWVATLGTMHAGTVPCSVANISSADLAIVPDFLMASAAALPNG